MYACLRLTWQPQADLSKLSSSERPALLCFVHSSAAYDHLGPVCMLPRQCYFQAISYYSHTGGPNTVTKSILNECPLKTSPVLWDTVRRHETPWDIMTDESGRQPYLILVYVNACNLDPRPDSITWEPGNEAIIHVLAADVLTCWDEKIHKTFWFALTGLILRPFLFSHMAWEWGYTLTRVQLYSPT